MSDFSLALPKLNHEQLVVRRGPRSKLQMCVAIHSTRLGPALGGLRLWYYSNPWYGIRDVLRLAEGMTTKAAAAGLDLGGGKGVICAARPMAPALKELALADFGELVEELEGRYITAEDVGISPEDLVQLAKQTSHVTGLPPSSGGSGDPSPYTALGVLRSMQAAAKFRFGSGSLHGHKVTLIGVGHVGEHLARLLVEEGAELALSDIDPSRRIVAEELSAQWLDDPEQALEEECAILSPCALGGIIDEVSANHLRCQIICGSANNQLADDSLADELRRHGILYTPDFIVNAGGLIHVYREIKQSSEEEALMLIENIGAVIAEILAQAETRAESPLSAAYALARARLRSQ
jgi:leucine dehydrogenase